MSRTTPTTTATRSSASTPLGPPYVATTSPTPSPRRHPLGPNHLPSSPRLGRIVPQRMNSGGSERDGSPVFDSPRRQTMVVSGFSPGNNASALPSVAEYETTESQQLSSRMPLVNTADRAGPSYFGSPGRSPRGLIPELPTQSRRNSAALVSISIKSDSRSSTPQIPQYGQSSSRDASSGQATPNVNINNATPRTGHSSQGSRPTTLVQMASGPRIESEDDWAPAGGMLLGDDDDVGRSWTEIDAEGEDDRKPHFQVGDRFGEGLMFRGEVIAPAVGRTYGHETDHPLRRGGSEMGMPRRIGPVGAAPTPGRERQKKVYEIIRAAGEGSFGQVYYIREVGGGRQEYALKTVPRTQLTDAQYKDQLYEATVHLSLPIHSNIVTLHETLQTSKLIFMLLEWCPGDDLYWWLEKSRQQKFMEDARPSSFTSVGPSHDVMSSSKYSTSVLPFSPGAMYKGLAAQHPMASSFSSSIASSPYAQFAPAYGTSPAASLIFSHTSQHMAPPVRLGFTPPTPSLLADFSAHSLLRAERLRLIASMFSQMCEAVAVCHEAGVSHRDIKPENFICCDSVELESVAEQNNRIANADRNGDTGEFGVQSRRRVIVKLTDFGLATTGEISLDSGCGSRPYMSPECLDMTMPHYQPAPADVWSLGICLLNMIFHRQCWQEPSLDDQEYVKYLCEGKTFFTNKFTGIGGQVASYLHSHVICSDIGDRVTARDLGKWAKNLPEMIAGRQAVREMKVSLKEHRANGNGTNDGLFAKSPIMRNGSRKTKMSPSALSTTAPGAPSSFQGLSSFPPPSHLANFHLASPIGESESEVDTTTVLHTDMDPAFDLATPAGSVRPADPVDVDMSSVSPTGQPIDVAESHVLQAPSPEDNNNTETHHNDADAQDNEGEGPDKGLNSKQRKPKKRGQRKGKATQAALAAERPPPTDSVNEALLAELAIGTQSLARDLSKTHIPRVDTKSPEQFPPLGTSDAQIAEAKASQANRSKWWREKLSFSSTSHNPELAAFAQRVAEREAGGQGVKGGFGNWSAPAKLQEDHRVQLASRPGLKQTTTMSTSGVTSQLSSFGGFGAMSSATSSGIEEEPEEAKPAAEEIEIEDEDARKAREAEEARSTRAIQAATLLSSNLGSMGSFGQRPQHVPRHGPLHGKNMAKSPITSPSAPTVSVPIASPIASPVVTKSKSPAHITMSPPASAQTARSINSPVSPPTTASTVKSPASLSKTTASSSTLPSLVAGSSTSALSLAPSAPNSLPPASTERTERQGGFKGHGKVLGNILRGLNLSNSKKE